MLELTPSCLQPLLLLWTRLPSYVLNAEFQAYMQMHPYWVNGDKCIMNAPHLPRDFHLDETGLLAFLRCTVGPKRTRPMRRKGIPDSGLDRTSALMPLTPPHGHEAAG